MFGGGLVAKPTNLVTGLVLAADLVEQFAAEMEEALAKAARAVTLPAS
jgi:hypothetical protein